MDKDYDVFLNFTGKKGSAMSSISLCEGISKEVVRIRGKKEDPRTFYNPSVVDCDRVYELLKAHRGIR
jgi:hypothetical protein